MHLFQWLLSEGFPCSPPHHHLHNCFFCFYLSLFWHWVSAQASFSFIHSIFPPTSWSALLGGRETVSFKKLCPACKLQSSTFHPPQPVKKKTLLLHQLCTWLKSVVSCEVALRPAKIANYTSKDNISYHQN